jgi:hypothetical protein
MFYQRNSDKKDEEVRKCTLCKMYELLDEGKIEYDEDKKKYKFICKYCKKLK